MGESSSSSSEDGDAAWKAAINSAAEGAASYMNGSSSKDDSVADSKQTSDSKTQQQLPKHYQIKAQKLLDDIVGKSLEIVHNPSHVPEDEPVADEEEGFIRLFKNAPPGIVFDHVDEQAPRKRPRILPGKEIDEKSKKFKRQIQSVAVDGNDIVSEARERSERALSRLAAKEAAAKEAAKREEERVAQLKKIRGEKWLPSIIAEKAAVKREEERVAKLKKIREERSRPRQIPIKAIQT